MYSSRPRVEKPRKSKKDKKLSNLINNSDSDTGNESEHELSYYMEDRVKLMKEVLKVIKSKKIKSMAPDCMKRMKIEEINSMLLEELLGISNKRLKYIFEGKNLDEESSTDEDQPIDVISLDDISDDDFVIISDEETNKHSKKKKRRKIKEEPKEKTKKIKKEKPDKENGKEKDKTKVKERGKEKEKSSKHKEPIGEENLMSVLELLELQARARAIRSQLDLETKRKREEQVRLIKEKAEEAQENGQDDDEEIIIEVPREVEIIITSSDSENEGKKDKNKASTSKENTTTNSTNSTSTSNINENTNHSSILISEDSQSNNNKHSLNDERKTVNQKSVNKNEKGRQKLSECDNNKRKKDSNDKEEGEVSDGDTRDHEKSDEKSELSTPDGVTELNGKVEESKKPNKGTSSRISDSGSDSSDNLQIVMLREKRKKNKVSVQSACLNTAKNDITVESKESSLESIENEIMNQVNINNTQSNEAVAEKIKNTTRYHECDSRSEEKPSESRTQSNSSDNDTQQNQSQIDNVIAEFLKTQPPPPEQTEELKILEEAKKNEEKAKQTKEKRLKNLKNKLQSYKKDVEGESSVTILENIVIKPTAVDPDKSRNKVAEDSDDLVINVDQDDLDCIICD